MCTHTHTQVSTYTELGLYVHRLLKTYTRIALSLIISLYLSLSFRLRIQGVWICRLDSKVHKDSITYVQHCDIIKHALGSALSSTYTNKLRPSRKPSSNYRQTRTHTHVRTRWTGGMFMTSLITYSSQSPIATCTHNQTFPPSLYIFSFSIYFHLTFFPTFPTRSLSHSLVFHIKSHPYWINNVIKALDNVKTLPKRYYVNWHSVLETLCLVGFLHRGYFCSPTLFFTILSSYISFSSTFIFRVIFFYHFLKNVLSSNSMYFFQNWTIKKMRPISKM